MVDPAWDSSCRQDSFAALHIPVRSFFEVCDMIASWIIASRSYRASSKLCSHHQTQPQRRAWPPGHEQGRSRARVSHKARLGMCCADGCVRLIVHVRDKRSLLHTGCPCGSASQHFPRLGGQGLCFFACIVYTSHVGSKELKPCPSAE